MQLQHVIEGRYDLDDTRLLAEPDKVIAAFNFYSKCFGDVLALGVFEYIVKNARCVSFGILV